ncbi:MAG: hypothetical protein V1944_00905 [Candidatus Aenigmatarchaeota archaeon]
MKNKILLIVLLLVIGSLASIYYFLSISRITIPPCFILKEVSTYSGSIGEEKAKALVISYVNNKGYSITGDDLTTSKVEGSMRVFVSINVTSGSSLCNTYEEKPNCIGQWYDVKNGKLYENQINPC